MQPTPVFLPGKFHVAWWATVHGSRELDTTKRLNHHKYIMRMVAYERIQLRKREIKD